MRRWSTWILILALILLALCVLWLLPRLLREEPAEPSRGIAAAAGPAEDSERPSRGVLEEPRPPTSTPESTTVPNRPAEARPKEPAPSRDAVEEEEPAPLLASLAGRLVDRTGRPVRGAAVLAARAPELGTPIDPSEWWIAHLPLDVADPRALGAEVPATATSDEEGRFELSGLDPGRVRLAVRAGALAPFDRADLRLAAGERLVLGDVLLEPAATIHGFLQDESGRPVARAPIVEVEDFSDASLPPLDPAVGRVLAVTDLNGGFQSRPLVFGPWSARALGGEAFVDAAMRGNSPAEGWDRLETLAEAGWIRGEFITHGGVAQDLVVRALPAEIPRSPVPFALRADARTGRLSRGGAFEIDGLAPGVIYELRAGLALERFEDESLWSPPLFAEAYEHDVHVRWEPDAAVSFALVDAQRRTLVADCTVELEGALPAQADLGVPEPDSEGLRVLSRVRPLRPFTGANLRVSSRGHQPVVQRLELRPGRATSLGALASNPVPSLAVRVVDAVTRAPLRAALVTALDSSTDLDASGLAPLSVPTDASGAARVDSYAGSGSEIEVQARGYARERRYGPFGGGFSAASVEVGLYRGATARIHVLDDAGHPVPGARVEWIEGLWSPNDLPRSRRTSRVLDRPDPETTRFTGVDGLALFSHLAPGRHAFRVQRWDRSLDGEWTERELADLEVAEIELTSLSRSSLDVRIADAGAPLAGAPVILLRRSSVDSLLRVSRIDDPLPPGIDARLDSAGAHAFWNVDPGTYVLAFAVPGQGLRGCREIKVGAGANVFSLDLAPSALTGRVTKGENVPVAGARILVSEPAREQELRLGIRRRGAADLAPADLVSLGLEHPVAVAGEDGTYRLLGLPPAETFRILAIDGSGGLGRGEPLALRTDSVPTESDVDVQPSGALEVHATTLPAAGPFFLLALPGDRRGIPRVLRMFPGRSGLRVALEPGSWDLQLADGSSRSRDRRRVEVVAGETRVLELSLP